MVGRKKYIPQKGDVIWLDFTPQAGREQAGRCPALVVSSGSYNKAGLMLACPITSQKKGYPFEVPVQAGDVVGVALADHVKSQDWKARRAEYICTAEPETLSQVQRLIAAILLQ